MKQRIGTIVTFVVLLLLFLAPKVFLLYLSVWATPSHCAVAIPHTNRSVDVDCHHSTCCGNPDCIFVPGLYHSTDFEVHRNWLSITSASSFPWLQDELTTDVGNKGVTKNEALLQWIRPLRYWYRENTSLWTLDYPPLFAFFEAFMALVLSHSKPLQSLTFGAPRECYETQRTQSISLSFQRARWLTSHSRNGSEDEIAVEAMHTSRGIVFFQRLSVIVLSDVPFFISCVALMTLRFPLTNVWKRKSSVTAVLLLLLNPGWILVDNIHFQYNGAIFALFLVSARYAYMNKSGLAAFTFFALVLSKHMMAYFALGYGVWGLAVIVRDGMRGGAARSFVTTLKFVVGLMMVLGVSLGPFVVSEYLHLTAIHNGSTVSLGVQAALGAVGPMKERLFPFGRGLCHAYWAPNSYVFYNVMDIALCNCRKTLATRRELESLLAFVDALFPRAQTLCGASGVNTKGFVGLVTTSSSASTAPTLVDTHAALPPVTPMTSNLLVVAAFLVLSCVGWTRLGRGKRNTVLRTAELLGSFDGLLYMAFLSATSFFLFSWHVHEKAVLNLCLPLLALALPRVLDPAGSHVSLVAALVAVLLSTPTLFPLLFTPRENVIKYAMYGVWAVGCAATLIEHCRSSLRFLVSLFVVVALLCGISVWVDAVNNTYFAPLMALSVCGAVVVHMSALAAVVMSSTIWSFPHVDT